MALHASCPNTGDAERGDPGSDSTYTDGGVTFFGVDENNPTDFDAADDTFTFTLKYTARDADGDGVVDQDDFTVELNGDDVENANYQLTVSDSGTGNGVVSITIMNLVPEDEDDSVVITYEYSEFDFAVPANTPLSFDDTTLRHGTLDSTEGADPFEDVTNQVINTGTNDVTGTVTTLTGALGIATPWWSRSATTWQTR
jgi:hypothetical protein